MQSVHKVNQTNDFHFVFPRQIKSLDGFWDFLKPNSTDLLQGDREKWYLTDLSKVKKHNNPLDSLSVFYHYYSVIKYQVGRIIRMPVPSSYNDVTTCSELRDHVGPVWYQRKFFVSPSWRDRRVFVRFGSVNYYAQVVGLLVSFLQPCPK